MTFVVTSSRDRPPVRYEKVGRLIPGEKGMVAVIRDGYGVIQVIPTGDLILVLNGMIVPGLMCSSSGNRIQISGSDGREYVVLTRQVRGMIRDWPKKKAAVFWEMGGREGNSGNIFNKK